MLSVEQNREWWRVQAEIGGSMAIRFGVAKGLPLDARYHAQLAAHAAFVAEPELRDDGRFAKNENRQIQQS